MIKSQRNKILKKMPNFEFMRDPTTLRTTENGFAKAGLLQSNFHTENNLSKNHFSVAKIQKLRKKMVFCG